MTAENQPMNIHFSLMVGDNGMDNDLELVRRGFDPSQVQQLVGDLSAELNASGATFPQTFYEEAIASFTEANDGVTINYAGGGSGKGRQDLADQIVDDARLDPPALVLVQFSGNALVQIEDFSLVGLYDF